MSFYRKNLVACLLMLYLFFLQAACGQKVQNSANTEVVQTSSGRVAIEFILHGKAGKDSLANLLREKPMEIYQWQNHIVLFGEASDTSGVVGSVLKSGIKMRIRRYNVPMYIFDKSVNCPDTATTPKPWNNYLFTANLVADTTLQQEYVNYHATQFEEWPEVAQGFCHAGFQQLLVYKNGRQLLLVISIPADKSLDELNPLTLENNPRMVEWNNIMGKYQEGVEGTVPGEVWVFLKKMK